MRVWKAFSTMGDPASPGDASPVTSVYNTTSLVSLTENYCSRPTASFGRGAPCWSECLAPLPVAHYTVNKLVFSWLSQKRSTCCRIRFAQRMSCESLDPKEPPLSTTEKDSVIKHVWEPCILLPTSHTPPFTINKGKQTEEPSLNKPVWHYLNKRMHLTICFLIEFQHSTLFLSHLFC